MNHQISRASTQSSDIVSILQTLQNVLILWLLLKVIKVTKAAGAAAPVQTGWAPADDRQQRGNGPSVRATSWTLLFVICRIRSIFKESPASTATDLRTEAPYQTAALRLCPSHSLCWYWTAKLDLIYCLFTLCVIHIYILVSSRLR